MRMQWGWTGIVATVVALVSFTRSTEAQFGTYPGAAPIAGPGSGSPYGMYGPSAYGVMPIAYQEPSVLSQPPTAGPNGLPGVPIPPSPGGMPIEPSGSYSGGMEYGSGMPYGGMPNGGGMEYGYDGGMEGCPYCGDAGCRQCMGGSGVFRRFASALIPYGEGGRCAPRWYDFSVEGIYLTREDVSRYRPFSSDGPRGLGQPVIVLDSDNLNFDDELGLRFSGVLHIFNQYNAEFVYMGLGNWSSAAQVNSPLFELFSVFSDFGTAPTPANNGGFNPGGFPQTDASPFHRIEYSSSFDSFEFNIRKRWTGVNCRVQGSTLMGARYFWLDEDFILLTQGNATSGNGAVLNPAGSMNYQVNTSNALTGLQVGGDLWMTLIPGISVGGDMKFSIMGNHVDQDTAIRSNTSGLGVGPFVTYTESVKRNDVAGMVEANIMSLWRLGPHWTVRSGYNFMYIDGVALAIENFNSTAPPTFVNNAPNRVARTPRLNDNGDLFFHGWTLGAEYMW